MTQVRVRTDVACPWGTWRPGSVTDQLPDEVARGLVEAGHAEYLEPPVAESLPEPPVIEQKDEDEAGQEEHAPPGPVEAAAIETPDETAALGGARPRRR